MQAGGLARSDEPGRFFFGKIILMTTSKTEGEFKKRLTPEEYHVLREKGTEPPFSGKYWDTKEKGIYKCRACGAELFSSDTKFDSGSGWPSFTEPMNPVRNGVSNGVNRESNVKLVPDYSHGMKRMEVLCKKCGSHLGHVFDDLPRFAGKAGGPEDKGGKRFCINSVCLDLEKNK